MIFGTQHSSYVHRTKTTQNAKSIELIKRDSTALPTVIVKHVENVSDPFQDFFRKRAEFFERKSSIENKLVRYMRLKKISRENNVSIRNLRDYIVHKLLDPAPYINNDLNYYPHHGTLRCLEANNNTYLVHVGNEDSIRFDKITSDMPMKQYHFNLKRKAHPTQLLVDRTSDFAIVMHKNEVKVAKIPDFTTHQNDTDAKIIDSFKSKKDILGSSLSGNYLSTIDSKFVIRRYNLNNQFQDVALKFAEYLLEDNLVPVSLGHFSNDGSNQHFLSFTTKNTFGAIDLRNKERIHVDNYFSSNDLTMKCEKIYTHTNSQLQANLVHIASSHILYTFDYRKLKEPIVRWTHQLYKPPVMLTTENYELQEVICAASYKVGDVKIFNTDGTAVSLHPYRPSSITTTYNELRENGLFLTSDDIKERVNASVTGVALISDPKFSSMKLFSQNCYGDVFVNNMSCFREPSVSVGNIPDPAERFQLWEEFIRDPLNPNKEYSVKERIDNHWLKIDDVVRFRNLPKYLNDDTLVEVNDLRNLDANRSNSASKPKWQFSIETARECDDIIAKEIMLHWDDVDDAEEEMELNEDEEHKIGADKVSQWLTNQHDEVIDAEMYEFTPECSSTQVQKTENKQMPPRRKSRLVGF